MEFPHMRGFVRPVAALAVAAAFAAPAFAFGAMGFHGGFHGGARAVGLRPAPPAIDAPRARPPFVTAPRPIRVRVGFVKFRPDDVFGRPARFDRRRMRRATLPWGWWGGGYGTYAVGAPVPVAMTEPSPSPEPAVCPELLTWSPRLGHAVRHRLCDAAPNDLAEGWAPVTPRG